MTKIKHPDGERVYLVFDARAAAGDTDDATVMEAFDAPSDARAKRMAVRFWAGTPFVLYGATFKDGEAIQDDTPLCVYQC